MMSKTRQIEEYVRGFCDACCLRTTGRVLKLCDTSSLGIIGTEKDEIPTNQKLIRLQIITPFAVIYSTRRAHTLRSKCDNGMNERHSHDYQSIQSNAIFDRWMRLLCFPHTHLGVAGSKI
jgi:hypothetical protein